MGFLLVRIVIFHGRVMTIYKCIMAVKFFLTLLLLCLIFGVSSSLKISKRDSTVEEVQLFLDQYEIRAQEVYSMSAFASWEYNTNVTDYNAQKSIEASAISATFTQEAAENASRFEGNFPDDIQRQLDDISYAGTAALDDPEKIKEVSQVRSDMMSTYSTGEVCREEDPTKCYKLDPGLDDIMANSDDYDELVWAWKGWRDVVGVANNDRYIRYVELSNEVALANGFPDKGALWRDNYEMGDEIIDVAYDIYGTILPLYKELHAYVRRKLYGVHGENINLRGRLPANVLGDMWGRFWGNIYRNVVPYPDKPNIDVTDTMVEQNYTALQMFHLADSFFTSMGLIAAPEEFWEGSMIVRPEDREVVCHATAWDFSNRKDFRIKMCTDITMDDLLTIHHEMGHIQYYLQYKDQPISFRGGANIAFHEAVGEVMTLSVATPAHLQKINLLEEAEPDTETEINFLLKMSLSTIGTLPFSLALEQWRWDVFDGTVNSDNWMKRWWDLKHSIVGVKAPVERSEDDFDPGAMFHIVGDYSFMRYYMRTIIQFQFHKAMCDAKGHTGPLHTCDIYESSEAGERLSNMLELGSSKPWPDAMEQITGQRDISADAIMEYFAPLHEWLQAKNAEMDEKIGWDDDQCTLGTDNCDENALCIEEDDGFTCQCNEGYEGNGQKCEVSRAASMHLPPLIVVIVATTLICLIM